MEIKILKNELNIGESGFYYVRMEFAKEDMPLNWFNVFQVGEGDYITEITHGEEWKGKPEIIYITHNGLHLGSAETFKTKEQALKRAKDLNNVRIYSYLDNLMEATNFLGERELLDIDDRIGRFLMEINARFNAFDKPQYPTEEDK